MRFVSFLAIIFALAVFVEVSAAPTQSSVVPKGYFQRSQEKLKVISELELKAHKREVQKTQGFTASAGFVNGQPVASAGSFQTTKVEDIKINQKSSLAIEKFTDTTNFIPA